jgi:hypothetical protein
MAARALDGVDGGRILRSVGRFSEQPYHIPADQAPEKVQQKADDENAKGHMVILYRSF